MITWRLSLSKWEATAFSGIGAAEFPGRWNSAGIKAVYCASSRALAALEILANAGNRSFLSEADFIAIPVTIDESLIETPKRLPAGWNSLPASNVSRNFGDRFLLGKRAPALCVPSVIIPAESCFVLNPLHQDFGKLRIGPPEKFRFDPRVVD